MQRSSLRYAKMGTLAVGTSSTLITLQMLTWYYAQNSLAAVGTGGDMTNQFFLLESLYLAVMVIGFFFFFRALSSAEPADDGSLTSIVAGALRSRRGLTVGVVAALAYGSFYSLISSILVYQPTVDFGATYGVTSSSWTTVPCCGSLGTTPMAILFVAPQLHLALQVVPLDLLMIIIIPILIGFNFSVAAFAVTNRPPAGGGYLLGSLGAAIGLFTSCPTCAGYFLASALGGIGATSLAIALAPYQLLFVAVSLPVLVVSPLLVAESLRRATKAACRVAVQSA